MQGRVARRLPQILTVSESSRRDIARDFGVDPARIQVIPLGVDEVFQPPTQPRVPGRIVAMASADTPMKGVATLLEARREAAHRARRRAGPGHQAQQGRPHRAAHRAARARGLRAASSHGISDAELVEVMGSAEVACVPSLYEGFSLPTAELMACETPLVVSRAGAIPEVVGDDGECADLVTPGDVGELYDAHRARCSTTPTVGPGWGPPAAAGCSRSSAGTRSRSPPPRPTSGRVAPGTPPRHADK